MKRKLLFIPSYYYLTNPLYESILRKRPDWHTVYFDSQDPRFYQLNKRNAQKKTIQAMFDEACEISIQDMLPYFSYYFMFVREDIPPCKKWDISRFPRYWEYQRRVFTALDRIKPDGIIQATDIAYSSKLVDSWARKRKVNVFTIQPSFIDFVLFRKRHSFKTKIKNVLKQYILRIPLDPIQFVYGNEYPRGWLFLWGEYFRDFYKGTPIYDHIRITGNPVFDEVLKHAESGDHSPLRSALGIPPGKKVILICTQDLKRIIGNESSLLIQTLYLELVKNLPEHYFIVKVHPREEPEQYHRIFEKVPPGIIQIIQDKRLHELFPITDVQVSVSSYSSLEAVVFGVPIVLVNPSNRIRLFDYFNGEVELKATDSENLVRNVKKALSLDYRSIFLPKREKFLEKRLGFLDGECAARVIEEINRIIDESKSERTRSGR
ncbi:CDP-glycerol glycerophosphotransferase family protein [Candidatus Sumerlaeota bacterium]|nr:CDP-glycerol glycerophosphotransferase family protein [Candidatus Sumerlaeota bacterium]